MASFFDNKARAAAASSSKTKAESVVIAPRLQPWVEKYRPKTLDEVRSQGHATTVLRRMVNASNLPHMLLYGPPGTGKTSTILALARELYGPELFHSRVLELNASDERGITVIRERVKNFAQQALVNAPVSKEYREKYPCPPFKIIILDEADNLTQDAQSALRRTMEIHSKITRFCLCANYASRIIDPVASRCSKFRFQMLQGEDAIARVKEILAAEDVEYEAGVIEKVLQVADGDLRRAINLLQSAARLVGAGTTSNGTNGTKVRKQNSVADMDDEDEDMMDVQALAKSGRIEINTIEEISGVIPTPIIENLLKAMRKGRGPATNYKDISAQVTELVAEGYSANETCGSLFSRLIWDEDVGDRAKINLTQVFSRVDKQLLDGADEHLTMLDAVLACSTILVQR